ncbi:uncharacterized protein METZ01_LOCUS228245, partial [marine metagenome]
YPHLYPIIISFDKHIVLIQPIFIHFPSDKYFLVVNGKNNIEYYSQKIDENN